MAAPVVPNPSPDPNECLRVFRAVLRDSQDQRSRPLWNAWHYLQVYCHWGVFIPHTEDDLALQWQMKNPGSYAFVPAAVAAYGEIHRACDQFLVQVFPAVVDLGHALLRFAAEADAKDGTFLAVVKLLDANDTQAVLELLVDLREQAERNSADAQEIKSRLMQFQSWLIEASGALERVGNKIEADEKTSQATIEKITKADPADEETLAGVQAKIKALRAQRQHDVTVAATTPTYFWAGLIGLVAASVVAGIYGARAVEDLKQINESLSKLQAMSETLSTAIAAHLVQESAQHSVEQANEATARAIGCTTTLQNAWDGMAGQIKVIEGKLSGTVRKGDGSSPDSLAAKAVVRIYVEAAARAWAAIEPDLRELMDKPYITVEKNAVSYEGMAAEIAKFTDAANAKVVLSADAAPPPAAAAKPETAQPSGEKAKA